MSTARIERPPGAALDDKLAARPSKPQCRSDPRSGGGTWYDTSIRGRKQRQDGILRNALYVGKIVWRRRLNRKDPGAGARRRRNAAPETYVTGDAPELRIVEDALWDRAQARLRANAAAPVPDDRKSRRAFWDRRRPRHLLSGKWRAARAVDLYPTGMDYRGCRAARHCACTNRRTFRRATLEAQVMDILGRQLMRPDLLTAFVGAFQAEWQRLDGEIKHQAGLRQRERLSIDRKIANLQNVITDGRASPAILAKLKELESTQRSLEAADCAPSAPVRPLGPGLDTAANHAARIAELTSRRCSRATTGNRLRLLAASSTRSSFTHTPTVSPAASSSSATWSTS